MRKQNTKATVPLDVVPERRTKRFPPRFRPVGRFCELRFRYLSSPTGREGEISRPLDHMRHIPFIHSVRLITLYISIYIEQSSRYFLHVVRSGVYQCRAYLTMAHALYQGHSFKSQTPCRPLVVFHTVRGDYWCNIDDVYACALLKISNSPFCVITFHSCLFVFVFASFFLDSKQIIFF